MPAPLFISIFVFARAMPLSTFGERQYRYSILWLSSGRRKAIDNARDWQVVAFLSERAIGRVPAEWCVNDPIIESEIDRLIGCD